ncbi:hypothetical protein HYY75_04505, partial [bacterium]|nr:hypothetical protein [bacterium]
MTAELSHYVLSGGNLVVFLGPGVDPNWYNLHLIDNLGGSYLLPARLVKRIGNSVSKAVGYQLTDLDLGHPAFKLFNQEGNGDPGKVRIFEFYQMEANNSAFVLGRLSHGLPAIIEERRGEGRVMLISFTADTQWSDWPLKPTLLPFLHQVVLGMLGKHGLGCDSLLPGIPVSVVLREKGLSKVVLQPPSGQAQELPIRREGSGLLNFST